MSTYSNRIRELRKNKSLSQEQLADKLGVTKQAVSQIERKLDRLKDLYVEELIDLTAYKADRARLLSELDKLS